MNTTGIVILLILIVLAAIAVALILAAKRRRRREELQGRFGSEYDRAVDQHGGRRQAESHLADVAERRDSLDIRGLSAEQQQSFSQRWIAVQTAFVDHPEGSVGEADRLVAEVMRERGYPVDDFDTKVDMVAADNPKVAEHYRAAHALAGREDECTTEERRQAFVHYRALFAELLEDGDHGRHAEPDDGTSRPVARDVDLTERDRSNISRRPE
jgi:hypothetical protein